MLSIAALLACVATKPTDAPRDTAVDSTGDSTADSAVAPPLQTRLGLCDAFDAQALDETSIASEDHDMADVRALGLGVARAHRPGGEAFAWNVIEPIPTGDDDWTLPDHIVATAQAANIRLVATLYPYADPTANAPSVISAALTGDQLGPWLAFVARIVERYDGDGVDDMPGLTTPMETWELGNEPACASVTNGCPQTYLDFQKATWLAAKSASPEARVILAGAGPVLNPDGSVNAQVENLYRYFFENGGAAYTDAFSFHVSVGAASPLVGDYLAWWAPLVGTLPIEIGESGTRSPGDYVVVSTDPNAEAAWYVDLLDTAYAAGVQHVSWCKADGAIDRAPVLWDALHAYAESLPTGE